MKGLGRTPSLGDRRGFMPPQLKTNKQLLTQENDFEYQNFEILQI
jgi:hypothetical protein